MPNVSSLEKILALTRPWPKSWSYDEQDLKPGAELVAVFEPFIRHLHAQGLATTTLRRHVNNLWTLGGDLIKTSRMTDPPQPIQPLLEVIDEEGGPLQPGSECEDDQRSFDATCKKLHAFLSAKPEPRARRLRKPTAASTNILDRLIDEAITDAYTDEEQAGGFLCSLKQHVAVPFATSLLGVEVHVTGFDADDDGRIIAECRRGRSTQRIAVIDLTLPTPPPAGHEWIAAYRRWCHGNG